MLKVVVLTALGLIAFAVFFFGWLFPDEGYVMRVIWVAVVLLIFSVGVYYAIINIRARDTFICRIDSEVIECVSPIKDCGDSFVVRLCDVTKVEKEECGDSCRWYIWNTAGERFWLTSNYDNPAEVFANAIRSVNPHVQHADT